MARYFLLLFILQMCYGCTMKKLFDPDQIIKIVVKPNDSSRQGEVTEIHDRKKIEATLEILNESSEELIKFYPKWHLIIVDSSKKEHLVMCSENEIKYEDKTYRLRENIKRALFELE
jgi:hypothetical protein